MFRNIIWDVDGTLFDTYPAIARAFQTALNDLGSDRRTSQDIPQLLRHNPG
jgi:phosphoglycolate phosphatase-like HAD superfamily hydrolase